MAWTQFMDMHSGGHSKEQWEYIYIEAPQYEACVVFYNRFGHSPDRVSCTCCGADYSVSESATLNQATGHQRNCEYRDGEYVEEPRRSSDYVYDHITLEKYLTDPKVCVIRSDEIKPEERKGDVPRQGYIWCS